MNNGHTTHIPRRGEGRGDVAVVPRFLAHSWGCGSLEWVTWRSRDERRVCAVTWHSCGARLAVVGVRRRLLAAGQVLGGGKWVGDVAGGGIRTGNRNGGANPAVPCRPVLPSRVCPLTSPPVCSPRLSTRVSWRRSLLLPWVRSSSARSSSACRVCDVALACCWVVVREREGGREPPAYLPGVPVTWRAGGRRERRRGGGAVVVVEKKAVTCHG